MTKKTSSIRLPDDLCGPMTEEQAEQLRPLIERYVADNIEQIFAESGGQPMTYDRHELGTLWFEGIGVPRCFRVIFYGEPDTSGDAYGEAVQAFGSKGVY